MQLRLGRNKGSYQSGVSAAGRFASDFNACGSVRESGWEPKASGGRLGEICEVFCFLENISVPVTHTAPRRTSRSREALGLCVMPRRRRRGSCGCVGRCLKGTGLGVRASSQPPRGQTCRLARQRAESCSICIKAQLITKGSRFSG